MISFIKTSGSDLSCRTRFKTLTAKNEIPLSKRFALAISTKIENLITGLKLSDAHNGLRVFTRRACSHIDLWNLQMAHSAKYMVPRLPSSRLTNSPWLFDTRIRSTPLEWSKYTIRLDSLSITDSKAMNLVFSLFLIVSLFPLLFVRLFRPGYIKNFEKFIILFLFIVFCLFSLFPLETAQPIATFFGIGRGSDLIFYVYITFSVIFFDFLYTKIKNLEVRQVKLMRSMATLSSLLDE